VIREAFSRVASVQQAWVLCSAAFSAQMSEFADSQELTAFHPYVALTIALVALCRQWSWAEVHLGPTKFAQFFFDAGAD